MSIKNFGVARDPDYGWIVLSTENRARSFALVPAGHRWSFNKKAEALAQAAALSGREIEVNMIETPERFELVADKIYGCAWGNY